jgi:GT2 family glycosyltransferase
MPPKKEISIIIPFKRWSSDLDECLIQIQKLSFKEFEVILLPDDPIEIPTSYQGMSISIIPTGAINPALKRDQGVSGSEGKYLAFIDDDAYPKTNWLDIAYKIFITQPNTGAVGGPAITPKTDSFWARVSGAVFLSRFSGGFPERYTPIPPARVVSDWPSVNLIVRRETFEAAGGFDSEFWPGEDTLFCQKISQKTSKIILYEPELIIWHHRRKKLQKHLRQIGNYGLHRGYFAKKFPENSRKIIYFIPTLWVLFVLSGFVISLFIKWLFIFYLAGWISYLIVLSISLNDICRYETKAVGCCAIPYILLTHFWYGIKFTQGLITKKLISSLGR